MGQQYDVAEIKIICFINGSNILSRNGRAFEIGYPKFLRSVLWRSS